MSIEVDGSESSATQTVPNRAAAASSVRWVSLCRRYLALAALMFWQGGFTFYAGVVVPIASAELGHMQQGFITRHVAWYLNLIGAVALILLAWDSEATGGRPWLRKGRWLTWAGMAAALALLIWLHPQLAGHMVDEDLRIVDRPGFLLGHRVYLWTCTIQWGFALVYAGLMVAAWRSADAAEPSR